MASPEQTYLALRKLAAENPRQARTEFAALLDSNSGSLEGVLRLAAAPGEGRLRQLIANSVKQRGDKSRLIPHLRRWLVGETDEFAKTAIAAALTGVDQSAFESSSSAAEQPHLVDTYRYVAERLCHRIRNSLTGPAQHLRALESLLNGGNDQKTIEAKATITQLKDSFRSVSRIVEFNVEDSYFEWRSVNLIAWLRAMTNTNYIPNNSRLTLRFEGLAEGEAVKIWANELMLETIFWNLWKNAQQAVGSQCEITIRIAMRDSEAELLFLDNGAGFSRDYAGIAFVEQFSSKGADRGRGLLEVEDAVRRLGGTVELVAADAGSYRVCMRLPLSS
jgi:signal transduction histidine kinase